MSRGLSKTQNSIIQILAGKDWRCASDVLQRLLSGDPNADYIKPSESQKQSFLRALRLLQKKGIVECRNKRTDFLWRIGNGRGGVSHVKEVRLSVEFKRKSDWHKHLEGAE